MSKNQLISIIIPTLNEELYLPKLLKCISSQKNINFEIIIADSNSSDNTVSIAKTAGAKVVKGGVPAVGRNNGFKESKGDIILFLDADISFNDSYLFDSIKEFKKRKLDLACSLFDLETEVISQKLHNFATNASFKLREKTPIAMATGATLFFKRDVFEKLKGFNQDLKIAEDQEIIRRAKKLKFKFGILKSKFKHSERRYLENGITKMLIGGFIGMIIIGGVSIPFKQRLHKKAEKLYGKWGEWKN